MQLSPAILVRALTPESQDSHSIQKQISHLPVQRHTHIHMHHTNTCNTCARARAPHIVTHTQIQTQICTRARTHTHTHRERERELEGEGGSCTHTRTRAQIHRQTCMRIHTCVYTHSFPTLTHYTTARGFRMHKHTSPMRMQSHVCTCYCPRTNTKHIYSTRILT